MILSLVMKRSGIFLFFWAVFFSFTAALTLGSYMYMRSYPGLVVFQIVSTLFLVGFLLIKDDFRSFEEHKINGFVIFSTFCVGYIPFLLMLFTFLHNYGFISILQNYDPVKEFKIYEPTYYATISFVALLFTDACIATKGLYKIAKVIVKNNFT